MFYGYMDGWAMVVGSCSIEPAVSHREIKVQREMKKKRKTIIIVILFFDCRRHNDPELARNRENARATFGKSSEMEEEGRE